MQITPSVHALRLSFTIPIAPGITLDRFVYSYIIYGETITLIDTGVAGCDVQIFDSIRSAGRDPREIKMIILTHSHPDHIGSAKTIRKSTGCIIATHPAERAWIEDVDQQNRERPVPGFFSLVSGSVQIDRELTDGDLIVPDEDPDLAMKVIHTPGHSTGSISLFMQNQGVLFSGDAIPVPGDLPVYDDAVATVRSIHKLRNIPGKQILLSAWDEPGRGEEVYLRMDRAVDHLQMIHEAVRSAIREGHTDLMALTKSTAASLGLPPQAVNPLLARTFSANLRVKDEMNLQEAAMR